MNDFQMENLYTFTITIPSTSGKHTNSFEFICWVPVGIRYKTEQSKSPKTICLVIILHKTFPIQCSGIAMMHTNF